MQTGPISSGVLGTREPMDSQNIVVKYETFRLIKKVQKGQEKIVKRIRSKAALMSVSQSTASPEDQ